MTFSPNRLNELEIIEAIQRTSIAYGISLDDSFRMIANALSKGTALDPEEVIEDLKGFYYYPLALQSFQNKDLHAAYYLRAGVGIGRIRSYLKIGQTRICSIRDDVSYFIPVYASNLKKLLYTEGVLQNLKQLVETIRIMHGHVLPDRYYDPKGAIHLDESSPL